MLDQHQWIKADLGEEKHIFRIATQGRYDYSDQWVTTYKLQMSSDGTSWNTMQNDEGLDKIYR